jgi:hypothetical protein
MDINGFISVRKDEKLDIYGKTLPSQEGTPVTIFIQYENQPYMEIQAITNADGTYLKSFTPEAVGTYRIYAQYINQHNTTVDSQSISFSARKSNQSVVQCHTEDKEIEQGDIISIFTQLFPNLENEKIHFQIKKPDSSFTSYRVSTDSQGKCDFNIALSEKGTWEIRAWWEGNDAYEGQYSKPLYLHPGIKTPRALIIAGGGIESNNMRETTKYLANRFYKLLIGRRLKDHSIHYMSSVENESNAFIDDTNPTENKIAEYLKSLYKNKPYDVDPETSLIIYLVDHGGYNSFQINSKDFLYADQFSQYLDALQEKTNCKVQLIIEACKSGSFMDELTQANIQNRIIITATGDNVLSYYDQDGRESFSSHLFNWLIQGFSLGESFSNASSMLRKKPKTYGDQVPEVNNLNIAKETYLGGTFLTGDRMPVFTAHTPNQVIDNQKLTITEKIEDEDADCTVWASIMPPNHHISYFDPSTTPQWQLETVNLRPKPGHKHFYEATYECFYQKGVYVVTVYAEDSAGNISSEEILVTVNESQLPPGWGHMDNNATIDLQDAIIALKILCQMPLTSINLENQLCNHKVSLEEVIYIFQMIMD